jgi:hypothetical protein
MSEVVGKKLRELQRRRGCLQLRMLVDPIMISWYGRREPIGFSQTTVPSLVSELDLVVTWRWRVLVDSSHTSKVP